MLKTPSCSNRTSRASSPLRSTGQWAVQPGTPAGQVGWPHRLQFRQGLRLQRGEVIRVFELPHVIVGFDGRHEEYLCWAAGDDGFDTSQLVSVSRLTAHTSPRDLKVGSVPPLPALDHIGRPVREGELSKVSREDLASTHASGLSTGACSPRDTGSASSLAVATDQLGLFQGAEGAAASMQPTEAKQCSLSQAIKVLVLCVSTAARLASLTAWRWWSGGVGDNVNAGHEWVQRPDGTYHRATKGGAPKVSLARATPSGAKSESSATSSPDDLQIRIPIVKPPGWEEVQPLVHQMPVTFDERGIKETMTVKTHRWGHFVDGQRAKFKLELEELKRYCDFRTEGAASTDEVDEDSDELVASPRGRSGTHQGRGPGEADECSSADFGHREDVRELEQMIQRMEDWKDLCRYSGKSISMASTRRGNEMRIHVLAFAEREDGCGVDFMRLDYRKSVEVRTEDRKSSGGLVQALRSLLPFIREPRADSETQEAQWVSLLRRPDVAKFAIALAFRSALQTDGVHLDFCDGSLEDVDHDVPNSGRRKG